jgi:metal-responsive CopG/Arc/MetJ family transcriptional regulator
MHDTTNMSARPVQISIDEDLLRRIDGDPETRERGRSAFLRSAAELYLELKGRRATDTAIRAAFSGAADELLAAVQDFLGAQAWPKK